MTRREKILAILQRHYPKGFTCQNICDLLITQDEITDKHKAKYLSGSVSSKLLLLAKARKIRVSAELKGPKGGKVYIFKPSENSI